MFQKLVATIDGMSATVLRVTLGLIVGPGTRVAVFGIGATIGVAALMVHAQHGFFMNCVW